MIVDEVEQARRGPQPGCRPGRRSRGFSLAEVLVAALVLPVVIYILYSLFRGGSQLARTELEILGLQVEGQRSLALLLRDLHESSSIVMPQPGHTLPYAVVRDKLNHIVHYSLVEAGLEGSYDLRRVQAGPDGTRSRILLRGIRRLAMSSLSPAALRVHLILRSNDRDFALYTQVRLRNRKAAEP